MPSSSVCRPDPSWLLRSAGSSAECVPDLPCYGWGNDQGNDQADPGETQQSMTAFRSESEGSISTGHSTTAAVALIIDEGPSDRKSDGKASRPRSATLLPSI